MTHNLGTLLEFLHEDFNNDLFFMGPKGLPVVTECFSASDSSSGGVVIRVWVQIPAMTLVSLSNTLNCNCFFKPKGKLVPVRAEMVLVIDLAWWATYLAGQAGYFLGS